MTEEPPQSAADPRDGEPYYIENECENCGSELVLYDELDILEIWNSPEMGIPERSKEIWHDEWVCPDCVNGIYMDWPEEYKEEIFDRAENVEENFTPLEEVVGELPSGEEFREALEGEDNS